MTSKVSFLKTNKKDYDPFLNPVEKGIVKEERIGSKEEQCITFDKVDIVLDIGKYNNYLDRMSHAAGISIQDYILGIIQRDRENNDDLYRELLELGERIKNQK